MLSNEIEEPVTVNQLLSLEALALRERLEAILIRTAIRKKACPTCGEWLYFIPQASGIGRIHPYTVDGVDHETCPKAKQNQGVSS